MDREEMNATGTALAYAPEPETLEEETAPTEPLPDEAVTEPVETELPRVTVEVLDGTPLEAAVPRKKISPARLFLTFLTVLSLLSLGAVVAVRIRALSEEDVAAFLAEEAFGKTREITLAAEPFNRINPLSPFMRLSAFYLPNFTPPSEEETAPPADLTEDELYAFDRADVPAGALAIVPHDISTDTANGLSLFNMSGYAPDLASFLAADYPIASRDALLAEYGSGAPLVLIVHTHATESYSPEGAVSYTETDAARNPNTEENVVAVGAVLAETLNARGIPTLHCQTLHDAESYRNSYVRAAESIEQYLEEYPSIRYVIDIHRDSLSDGEDKIRPVALCDGAAAAQMMIVVGSDSGSSTPMDWENNMTVATKLQSALWNTYPTLVRPLNLRGSTYNEEYTPGSLLVEVGSCGNYLSEAKTSAKILGEHLADLIIEAPSGAG